MHALSTLVSTPNRSATLRRGSFVAARRGHARALPGQRGVALIYTILLGMVMIGFLGIAVDSAYILSTKQQLQHAADAAALAGVQKVKSELNPLYPVTRKSAADIAASNAAATLSVKLDANAANLPDGDIVVGVWDPFTKSFTPSLLGPNAVQVRAKRDGAHADGPLGLLFGPVFGTETSDVGAVATAVFAPAADPLILVLDPVSANALRINGTNTVNAMAGKVHANSSSPCGISLVGTPILSALQTSVVGGACFPAGSVIGAVVEGAAVVPDPLAHLLPTTADWNAFKASLPTPLGPAGQISASGTYEPGFYPKGLDAAGSEVISLKPGYYMLGRNGANSGLKLGGSAFVTGNNVTIFIDHNAGLDISGSGAGMALTPPGVGDPFQGVTVFHHRLNSGAAQSKISGGGLFKVEGFLYVPSGELIMGGTPGKEVGGMIVYTAKTEGTTGYVFTGKGLTVPKGPEYPFLVE
jgi:Flp pilus assembly protein TadG